MIRFIVLIALLVSCVDERPTTKPALPEHAHPFSSEDPREVCGEVPERDVPLALYRELLREWSRCIVEATE